MWESWGSNRFPAGNRYFEKKGVLCLVWIMRGAKRTCENKYHRPDTTNHHHLRTTLCKILKLKGLWTNAHPFTDTQTGWYSIVCYKHSQTSGIYLHHMSCVNIRKKVALLFKENIRIWLTGFSDYFSNSCDHVQTYPVNSVVVTLFAPGRNR